MNAKTLEAVRRHGESLLAAFPNATEKNPVALCKKLRRIETSLTRPLTDSCNGTFEDDEEGTKLDAICNHARERVEKLLGASESEFEFNEVFHVNRDPRGYALKIDDEATRAWNHRCYVNNTPHLYADMGGYGILAPDLNQ